MPVHGSAVTAVQPQTRRDNMQVNRTGRGPLRSPKVLRRVGLERAGDFGLRAQVEVTNGTSLGVSHFLTGACATEPGRPSGTVPRGLGLFQPLQRLRHRWTAKDEDVNIT